jgi:hypothetical protein
MKYSEGLSIFCPFDSGAQFMIFAPPLVDHEDKAVEQVHISGA